MYGSTSISAIVSTGVSLADVNNIVTAHNIVTKISTEAEIVGVSDGMGINVGLRYLLEEQGYSVKPLILYQDVVYIEVC